MSTATPSPLALGMGVLEGIADALERAGLLPAQVTWNTSDSDIVGGAIVQMHGADATVRAARVLFDTATPPLASDAYDSLLSYKGKRQDGIRLHVFGGRQ